MMRESSFEQVRDRIARDLRPVRPLRGSRPSALVALPIVIFLLSFVLLVFGIRNDAAELGFWPLWGPAAIMVTVAYGILVLALAQRTPETRTSWVGGTCCCRSSRSAFRSGAPTSYPALRRDAVLVMALVGLLAGLAWEHGRLRRYLEEHPRSAAPPTSC